VNLSIAECRIRLNTSDHGILSTVHPERLIDSVPVCFVVSAEALVIPIDRVKPKQSSVLQRSKNLALEPRATLLCGREQLREKYSQYQTTEFADLLIFSIDGISGWSAIT